MDTSRRLLADQRYFGLDAQVLRSGARRVFVRIGTPDREQLTIDVRDLAADFRLDATAALLLLRALRASGLLHPDGTDRYRPTALFQEYALARVVAPLSRARARVLIDSACALAARINAGWARNPFQIETIAVSGSYMSRLDSLPELALWVMLRPRPQARIGRRKSVSNPDEGLREIQAEVNALSSFMVVRVVADRKAIPRPFSVVFQESEDVNDGSLPAWAWLRDLSTSITRRIASR